MSTSKPLNPTGGKGSVRRNEDNDAYRDNYDAIFGKGKKNTMIDEQNDEREPFDEEWTCDVCGGPMYRQAHWSYGQCDDCGARQELIDDDYL